ncbi:MAG: hypothetical protein CMN86_11725 [Stappia sp.]|nr:hypothetical protein [Stappia sp.]
MFMISMVLQVQQLTLATAGNLTWEISLLIIMLRVMTTSQQLLPDWFRIGVVLVRQKEITLLPPILALKLSSKGWVL